MTPVSTPLFLLIRIKRQISRILLVRQGYGKLLHRIDRIQEKRGKIPIF
jgi:hypothetical protein